MSGEMDKEQWLRANTFLCKLGRLSPVQCERNRKRPGLFEEAFANYKPTACTNCQDWARLCEGITGEHKAAPDATPSLNDEPISEGIAYMESQPAPERIKCECGVEFEPYKFGAVTVKSSCRDCFIRKTAGRGKKRKETPGGDPGKARQDASKPAGSVQASLIAVPFSGRDEGLFQRIEECARRERRTPEAQVLYWLETRVPELRADAGDMEA